MRYLTSWNLLLALQLFVGLSLVGSWGSPVVAAGSIEDITLDIATDRALYPAGESITFRSVECNPTDEDITIVLLCSKCGRVFEFFDAAGNSIASDFYGTVGFPEEVTWPAGECLEVEIDWNQGVFIGGGMGFEQVPDGDYSATVRFADPAFGVLPRSEPVFFSIGSGPTAIPTLSSAGVWGLIALLSASAVVWLRRTRPGSQT